MNNSQIRKAWSTDEYYSEDFEQVCQEAFEAADLVIGDTVEINEGTVQPLKASDFVDSPDSIFMQSDEYNKFSEYTHDWLNNMTQDQTDELDVLIGKTVDDWATKNNMQPTFYRVIDVKPITIKWFGNNNYDIVD